MTHKLSTTTLLLSLFLAPTAVASTTWYVNGVSGSDSNNCTSPTNACKTIRHAVYACVFGRYDTGCRSDLQRESHPRQKPEYLGCRAPARRFLMGRGEHCRHNLQYYRPCDFFKAHYSQRQRQLRRRHQQLWHADTNQQHGQCKFGAYPVSPPFCVLRNYRWRGVWRGYLQFWRADHQQQHHQRKSRGLILQRKSLLGFWRRHLQPRHADDD